MEIYTALCSFNLHGAKPSEYESIRTKLYGLGFDDELMYEGHKRKVIMPNTTLVGEFYEDSLDQLEKYLEKNISKAFDILDIKANFFLLITKEFRWTSLNNDNEAS